MKYTAHLAFSGGILAMKFGRFHDEIWQISWQWNLADFMVKSGGFHGGI